MVGMIVLFLRVKVASNHLDFSVMDLLMVTNHYELLFVISVWRQSFTLSINCSAMPSYWPLVYLTCVIFPFIFSSPACVMSICAVQSACAGNRGGTVHKIHGFIKKATSF